LIITKLPNIPPDTQEGKGKKKMECQDFSRDEGIMITNLDSRADFEEQRPQPEGGQILIQIGLEEGQNVKVGANIPPAIRGRFIKLLKVNKHLFAWVSFDMPGVNRDFACHCLAIKPGYVLVAQKKQRMDP
jgi:hypothetical protein